MTTRNDWKLVWVGFRPHVDVALRGKGSFPVYELFERQGQYYRRLTTGESRVDETIETDYGTIPVCRCTTRGERLKYV